MGYVLGDIGVESTFSWLRKELLELEDVLARFLLDEGRSGWVVRTVFDFVLSFKV